MVTSHNPGIYQNYRHPPITIKIIGFCKYESLQLQNEELQKLL